MTMEAFEPQCPTPEASAPYVGHHLGLLGDCCSTDDDCALATCNGAAMYAGDGLHALTRQFCEESGGRCAPSCSHDSHAPSTILLA
jgi:hypothetical protein